MRRRIIGIFLALLSASLGTVLLVLYVQSAKDDAVASVRLVEVLVVDKPIPKGAAPTPEHVRLQEVPAAAKAENAILDLAVVRGLVATTTLLPGEQLVRERFAAPQVVARGDVPPGMLELTIPVARDRAVGGKIRPGGRVAVFATFEPGAGQPQQTHVLLHKVLVTAVQSEAPPPEAPPAEGQPRGTTQAPTGSFLVTVAVDAPTAERLIFAQETGSLWLAVEPDDAPESGTKFVTRENVF